VEKVSSTVSAGHLWCVPFGLGSRRVAPGAAQPTTRIVTTSTSVEGIGQLDRSLGSVAVETVVEQRRDPSRDDRGARAPRRFELLTFAFGGQEGPPGEMRDVDPGILNRALTY
jgi:hypothetical protein